MKQMMIAAIFGLAALPLWAVEAPESMTAYAREQMQIVATHPTVIRAIQAQNETTAGLSDAQIIELDQTWRAETKAADRPLINATLAKPASVVLSELAANSQGRLTEVFVMDARGLNVGQSTTTSDYWQGDEEKFTETFPNGADAMHVSEIEFDESTQTYQGQVSISIVDPDTGVPIGAVTFGIDATSFF